MTAKRERTSPKAKQPDFVQELRVRETHEPIAAFLGSHVVELTPGYARISMKLRPEHLNFNGYIFGGIIMSLADQAFGYASNSLALPSVATQFNIHFISGPALTDELTAEGRVVHNGRRAGITEITVTNQAGKLIARATGTTIPLGES